MDPRFNPAKLEPIHYPVPDGHDAQEGMTIIADNFVATRRNQLRRAGKATEDALKALTANAAAAQQRNPDGFNRAAMDMYERGGMV